MRRTALGLPSVSLLLVAAMATSALASPPRETVERMLGGYEPTFSREQFQGLGEGADTVLIEIALDPTTRPIRRLRALAALGYVPTQAGRAVCEKVIRDQVEMNHSKRILEVGACAEVMGNFGPTVAAELLPLLSHPATSVRTGALRGLLATRVPGAAPAFRKRLAVETNAHIRQELEAALASLATR